MIARKKVTTMIIYDLWCIRLYTRFARDAVADISEIAESKDTGWAILSWDKWTT